HLLHGLVDEGAEAGRLSALHRALGAPQHVGVDGDRDFRLRHTTYHTTCRRSCYCPPMSDPPSGGANRAWDASKWVILVHGGAGDIDPPRVGVPAAGCLAAAEVGAKILRAGGSALDAVEATVKALEDDPKFNAGTGACLNEAGDIELDASIMEGKQLRAGGVAALP